MNFSITSLSAKNVMTVSPILVNQKHLNIFRMFLSCTASINIFSWGKLSVSQSYFVNSLDSCIKISNSYEGFSLQLNRLGSFAKDVRIQYTLFANMTNLAIYDTSSYSVDLYRNIFVNIYSSGNGGSIFKEKGRIYIYSCCFERCRCANSATGCVFYLNDLSITSIVFTTVFQCWSSSSCGTCTARIVSSQTTLKSINSTSNKNSQYTCVIEPTTCLNAEFSHCHYLNGYSTGICHPLVASYTMSYINIIKNTGTVAFFAFYQSSIRLENCFIFQNSYPTLHCYIAGTFVTCFGDVSFSGITYRSSISTYNMTFDFPNNCNIVFSIPPTLSMFNRVRSLFFVLSVIFCSF